MRAWEISDTAPLIILFIGTPPNAALITSWDLDKLLKAYNLSWGLDITLVTSLEPKYSLDLDKVSLMSHNLSLLLLRLFFKLDWATFSKMASLDLDKYRLRSVILSRQVWHDLLEVEGPEWDPFEPPPCLCSTLCSTLILGTGSNRWSGVGILSMSGDGEGGSSSVAKNGWARHCLTLGLSLEQRQKWCIQSAILNLNRIFTSPDDDGDS